MKTLVSTNVLPFMQLFSGSGMNPADVESPFHQIQGCTMRSLVRFITSTKASIWAAKRPLMDCFLPND
jgi:hypothetical protein